MPQDKMNPFGKMASGQQSMGMGGGMGGANTTDPMQMGGGPGGPKQGPAAGAGMMAPVASFNQRRQNAQSLYGPGGAGWANFGGEPMGPRPAGGMGPMGQGGMMGPRTRPMEPPPSPPPVFQNPRPQGPAGLQGGGFQRPPMPGQFGPPQQAGGMGQMGPAGGGDQMNLLRQLFSQPGFMQLLQQYMQRQGPPSPSGLPPAGGGGPALPPQY